MGADDLVSEIGASLGRMVEFYSKHKMFLDLRGENLTFNDLWKIKEELTTFHREELNREISGRVKKSAPQISWPF